MRCLFCGKELALLKRWTGGGEFCSDAHRQQYQEEYNQLALNRLLQAKPRDEKKPLTEGKTASDPKPAVSKRPETTPAAAPTVAPAPPTPVSPSAVPEPVPVRQATRPEEPAPAAPAEFLVEIPVPAQAEVVSIAKPDAGWEFALKPALPHRKSQTGETQLAVAGRVVFGPLTTFLDYSTRPGDRGVEVRDFVRSARFFEVNFPRTETGLEIAHEPIEVLVSPQPPQGSPALWQEPESEFGNIETELGVLAGVVFQTTGLQDNEEPEARATLRDIAQGIEAPIGEEPTGVDQPAGLAPSPPPGPDVPAQHVIAPPQVIEQPAAPAPRSSLRPSLGSKASEKPLPQTPGKRPEPVPGLVTKTLPLTLHGLAAGRGKPVQVFPLAAPSGINVQVPRSSALPLRPLMTLGPAPVLSELTTAQPGEKRSLERPVVVKTDPRRPSPARTDPRLGNAKERRPEVRILAPENHQAEKNRASETRIGSPDTARGLKEPAAPPVKSKPDGPLPGVPTPAALQPVIDLGLPSLSLAASGSFWSKLPMPARIGLAVGVFAVVGAIAVGVRGGIGTAASGPRVVEAGPPLPSVNSGWISDWGNDPSAARQRQILVLRSSLNLTDYRMEFQGQIENKAMGWVFRARDPKNFYVMKLEIQKSSPTPSVALVRFAMINGEEQQPAQIPLPIPVRPDTLYKVRFEAVGNSFTTWVQDRKVDEWTDNRISSGGVGLYNERGESASLKGGVNVVPLVIKK